MKKIVTILVVVISYAANAQVGWADRIKTPREIFAVQKIWDAEKALKLKRGNHIFSFGYRQGAKEGFTITTANNKTTIEGSDETGFLYGCLEFAAQLKKLKSYPKTLNITDAPEMVLRGQCIGLQKSTYLPGRNVYEYPYTPETFPWFYDKKL